MRTLLATVLVLAMICMAGCRKQQTGDIDTLPPMVEFDTGPVYGSADVGDAPNVDPEPVMVDRSQAVAPAQPAASNVHVVARGDTLWNIAVRYYGDGQRWRDIAAANGNLNPSKMAVGQRLVLP